MVGGLVQHQQVDGVHHQHAQLEPGQLAAGEGGHRLEYVLPPETEGGQLVPGLLGGAVLLVDHGVHQAALRVLEPDDLGQIAHLDRGAEADAPLVGALLLEQDLQQGGFARAVVPQQGDALAPQHLQLQAGEQGVLPIGLGHPLQGEEDVPPELGGLEPPGQIALLPGLVGGAHPLDALLHGEGPLVELVVAHEGPQVHLVRRLGELGDLGLLLLILLEPLLIAALPLHHIEAVVAGVELRLALVQGDDPVHAAVQEIAVMGDGEHRAPEAGHIVLQPLHRMEIQVVGGLVQQQDVGVLQNQPAQVDPGLLPAGEGGKGAAAHFL